MGADSMASCMRGASMHISGMTGMTNVTDMPNVASMSRVSDAAHQHRGQHEKQPEQKTANKDQGKWISCHSFAPSASGKSQP
jgi:hypothetical protein